MVACELNNLLGRYHDGELAGEARRRFEQHLADCAQCGSELEQMRQISRMLRSGEPWRASAEFVAELEALAVHVEDANVVRFVTRLTAAAAAILVAATCYWTIERQTVSPRPTQTALTSDERAVLDPDLLVASATSADPAADSRADLILDLSGGRP